MLKSFADGRLFGRTWGPGVPNVLALHGWRRSHLDFTPVFDDPEFAGRHPALAVDLPGFGDAPVPPDAWGTEAYARYVACLFDTPGILSERVVLLGHSFGGRVAVRLCGMVPDRIERVVLTGVPLVDRADRATRLATTYRLVRRLHRMGVVGDARMEAMRQRYGSPDYRAAHGVMRQVFVRVLAEDYRADLGAIGCPVDLVWGEEDTEVPVEVAARAGSLIPMSTLRVLPGVGHLTPVEAPAALRQALAAGSRPGSDGRS